MNIENYIVSKDDCKMHLVKSIQNLLHIDEFLAEHVYLISLSKHIVQLKDTISILVEAPYVDRVYRDSYYTYFSSKLGEYAKDCVRLSFFEGIIDDSDFKTDEGYKELKKNYRGFIVLRPTIRNIIGRSVISPKALINNHFIICSANFPSSANFVKFEVEGFPHSSQDTETISCAETTLWAVMEYFGHKYPEYKPVLPSKIIEVLRRVSTERQIPSRGLNINQISYALREFGFGTRLYSRNEFGEDDFSRLFSCYVESGIPLIVALQGGSIGHAVLCIGHHKVISDQVDNLLESKIGLNKVGPLNVKFFDNDDIKKEFIFIDDNMPICQQALYESPTSCYDDDEWKKCNISHFIAPLYPKIYLEAFEAKNFCINYIFEHFRMDFGSEIYLRFFLTSSRSFKSSLNFNNPFPEDLKYLILEKPMPKFIWVGELSSKELIKKKEANGLVLLDATEANTSYERPLIMALYLNNLISFDSSLQIFTKKDVALSTFSIFTNNLK